MTARAVQRGRGAVVSLALALAALAPARVAAEIVVFSSRASASIQVMSGVFDPGFVAPVEQAQSPVTDFAAALAATPAGPFSATARSSQTARVEAQGGTLSVRAEGSTFVSAPGVSDPPLSNLFAQATNSFSLAFRVTERASVAASASTFGTTLEGDAATISCDTPGGPVSRAGTSVSLSLELDAGATCSVSAVLGVARNGNRDFLDPGERAATLRVSISVSEEGPDDGTVFRWVGPAQGAFAEQGNWENENGGSGVPSFRSFADADAALVEGESALDLDLGGALSRDALPRGAGVTRQTGRLVVRSTQRLRPFGGTLLLDSLEPGLGQRSLEIDGAGVFLDQGGVTARHVAVGQGSDGALEVVGPDGFFTTLGRFGIGGDADGNVTIRDAATVTSAETILGEVEGQGSAVLQGPGSLWQTGNLAVGFADDAALTIEGGARMESEKAFVDCKTGDCVGLAGDERARVSVVGRAGNGTPSTWQLASDLDVGSRGAVLIDGGGRVSGAGFLFVSVDGDESDCLAGKACIEVRDGELDVAVVALGFGTEQQGTLAVGPAGRVVADLAIAGGLGSKGRIVVTGPSSENQIRTPSLGISLASPSEGGITDGALVLEAGAKVEATTLFAGDGCTTPDCGVVELRGQAADPAATRLRLTEAVSGFGSESAEPPETFVPATGVLLLQNALVEQTDPAGRLEVRRSGSILGSGEVAVAGRLVNDGHVGCGVVIRGTYEQGPTGRLECPALSVGSSLPQLNPLAASRFARGLRARPVPPPAPPSGPFVVDGDATLGGTLVLQFRNGFAPRTGDAFELLDVSGTVSGAFADVSVRGLAPGADFAQDVVDGKLTLTSLTDAESLPVVSVKAKPALVEGKPKKGLKMKLSRKGDTAQALAVRYVLRGTARNGLDYEELPGVIEIPARKKSAKLALRAFADGVTEGIETLSLEILPGDGYTTSLFSKVDLAISDQKPKRR
jgi:T5SS/PEP-CTERM-associated repeat protein